MPNSSSDCRSGLSWLAWAVGTPVVMISGFTHPTNEFATPYRVINYHACNSCWNDVRHRLRSQRLPVVSAPRGYAAAVRMHEADHAGACDCDDSEDAGLREANRGFGDYRLPCVAVLLVIFHTPSILRRLWKSIQLLALLVTESKLSWTEAASPT